MTNRFLKVWDSDECDRAPRQLRMENGSVTPLRQPIVFELESFHVPAGYGSLLFVLALVHYTVVLLGNGAVMCIIVIDKNLHRPMFVLLCNLVVIDVLGSTAVLPRLMMQFLTGEKRIAYITAMAQAFTVHMYGAAVQTLLAAMAYDRYRRLLARIVCNLCCAWTLSQIALVALFPSSRSKSRGRESVFFRSRYNEWKQTHLMLTYFS